MLETTVASAPPLSRQTGHVSTPRLWVGALEPSSLFDLGSHSPRANTCETATFSCVHCRRKMLWSTEGRLNSKPQNRSERFFLGKAVIVGAVSSHAHFPSFPRSLPLFQLLSSRGLSLSLVAFSSRTWALAVDHIEQDEAIAVQPCLPGMPPFCAVQLHKGGSRGVGSAVVIRLGSGSPERIVKTA